MRQFITGFMFGIIISLVYNTAMYFSLLKTSDKNSLFEYHSFVKKILEETNNLKYVKKDNLDTKNICDYNKNGPRILCTVFTYKKNFRLKAQYVDETWGKRCDKTIFISGQLNETEKQKYSFLDIIYLNVTDTNRLNLTMKTIQTLLYANKYLINQFDWILKADDDTYVIVENLKKFLSDKCPNSNYYYGFKYKPYQPDTFFHDFNSGGAGYVISNSIVRKFSEVYTNDIGYCRNITGLEDVDIGKCLLDIDVHPGDSRDQFGLERFHPLSYESMWNITPNIRTFNHSRYNLKKHENCCSKSSISFHYTTGQKALQLDYLLYKLRPTLS